MTREEALAILTGNEGNINSPHELSRFLADLAESEKTAVILRGSDVDKLAQYIREV